jgi:hypothetical protein
MSDVHAKDATHALTHATSSSDLLRSRRKGALWECRPTMSLSACSMLTGVKTTSVTCRWTTSCHGRDQVRFFSHACTESLHPHPPQTVGQHSDGACCMTKISISLIARWCRGRGHCTMGSRCSSWRSHCWVDPTLRPRRTCSSS